MDNYIPANFFWDISVRFLSWECWDFWRRHDHFRRFQKNSEVFRRSPKSSEDVQSLPKTSEVCRRRSYPSPSLRTPINGSSLPVVFTSKIRDARKVGFTHGFRSPVTWVWVNIFLEIVSSKTATTHIFQSGVRNWPTSVSRCEIEVFNPQAWELAGIQLWVLVLCYLFWVGLQCPCLWLSNLHLGILIISWWYPLSSRLHPQDFPKF